jgi:hypothetical protein
MTDSQRRTRLIAWAKENCQNDDLTDEQLELFLEQAIPFSSSITGKTSESLGDYSVSFNTDFPASIMRFLKPYNRVKFL